MKLLLFDIDGTMLLSNGSGRRAMKLCLSDFVPADTVSFEGIDFGGRTDPQILHDILTANGLDADQATEVLPDVIEVYAETFANTFMPERITILEGIIDLIHQLAELDHVQLALLTGNVQKTAYIKVDALGLAGYFPFGAFGSDHADRYQLPRVALKRARDHNGQTYREKNVVIIGDTKHDILCGRDLNVFSVAVSTGHYRTEELEIHRPDLLLPHLKDAEAFIDRVVHAQPSSSRPG